MRRSGTFVFFCLCVVAVIGFEDANSRLVETAQGPVRGYRDPKNRIFSFYDIPYATGPTGVDKFKAPLAPPKWTKPFDAIKRNIICPQPYCEFMPKDTVTQEDCLVASVHVPETNDKKLPVLVLVHGGGFQIGFGNWFTINKMINKSKVIVVSFNYRLGLHGFLCLGTETAPGNAGMKDQVALLMWVRRNIGSFGGDPDDVTIYGGSAGAASVDLLMLSRSAEGLFKKVIADSGANVAVFTVQIDPIYNAKSYANELNFTKTDDINALEEFYKTSSLDKLLINQKDFFERPDSTFHFSPCVERETEEEMFLEHSPVDILKTMHYRKVPILYGFANMEGLIRIEYFDLWKDKMNKKFSEFLPADLAFNNEKEREEVAAKVKEFYFGDKPVSNETVLGFVNYFTDVIFAYPALRSVKLQLEAGHDLIYLYEYSFVDERTPVVPHTNIKGANHCAQSLVIFDGDGMMGNDENTAPKEFKEMRATMQELWSNFILNGEPTGPDSTVGAWPPVSKDWAPHMSLGTEVTLSGSLLLDRAQFWEAIYKKHYRNPIPPSTKSRHVHTEL